MFLVWVIVAMVLYLGLGVSIMYYKKSKGNLCTDLRDWMPIWPLVLFMDLVNIIYDRASKKEGDDV